MYALRFIFLFATWLVLSGRFDATHVGLGVLSAAIVAHTSRNMVLTKTGRTLNPGIWFRFPAYALWFLGEIFKANIEVLQIATAADLRSHLTPQVVEFHTTLKRDVSRVVLANSITLTPGTVTISVDGDRFVVHALTREMAESVPGDMERRIAAVFEPGEEQS